MYLSATRGIDRLGKPLATRANEQEERREAVFFVNPQGSVSLIVSTAKTQAIAGATAGATLGVVRSVISVRRKRLKDGYDVLTEGMTQIGIGAALGLVSGMAAGATGVTVAAIAGRSVWTVAAPLVASAIASSLAHERVDRLVRPLSAELVQGLKETLEGKTAPGP